MQESKKLKFETLNKESKYQGFFRLNRYQFKNQLFAGGWSETYQREIFERGHAAGVLLIDPNAELVVLVEQFRPGAVETQNNPWLIEPVAGIIESGEVPEEVARREAVEEAACEIKRIGKICEYLASPGGSTEKIWLFIGEVDSQNLPSVAGLEEEHEDIRIHKVAIEEAFSRLQAGEFANAMTLIALQWLKIHWPDLEPHWQ